MVQGMEKNQQTPSLSLKKNRANFIKPFITSAGRNA
jgi:hypothetical protein